MITILIPNRIKSQMENALNTAGSSEIGGILMGEHVAENVFRITEITIQKRGGSFASFVRVVEGILEPMKRFFHITGHNYRIFNYLGEWHSHPMFSLLPSSRDQKTMRELVNDPSVGANFAVLITVKLNAGHLQGLATVFVPGGKTFSGHLTQEEDS